MAEASVASSSCDDEEENREIDTSWSDLPSDLLSLILSNLAAADVFAFKAVCKSWKQVIPPPLPLSPSPNSLFFASPSLICCLKSDSTKMFHPLHNKFYHVMGTLPQESVLHCSKYGWLLMNWGRGSHPCFIDPFRRIRFRLPSCNHNFLTMSFFSRPSSLNWTIVGIVECEDFGTNVIATLKSGEKSWRICQCETRRYFRVSCPPVLFQGMYYFLDIKGKVGILDPEHIENGWKIFDSLKCRLRRFVRKRFMVRVDEQLVAVFVTHAERKVRVMKLNLLSMVWEPLQDLGDNTLYLSSSGSFARAALTKSMANTIYFPMFFENSGVFYSLKTGKYHSLDGKFCCRNSYGLTEREFGTWVQPTAKKELGKRRIVNPPPPDHDLKIYWN
ncbi:F-box/kelch-repeat protein At1g57790-like [Coffea eugenioides]|uniref:F-box/kelch-repeat protein At1g57790-like n=1 Tax=Coffea arabica TaxID=13443 RepID=A0ABM4V9G7_COFAR|nr:F-box/kelch-repeat protein At1g57790-like [Coffea eugenioides]